MATCRFTQKKKGKRFTTELEYEMDVKKLEARKRGIPGWGWRWPRGRGGGSESGFKWLIWLA